jgi:hypothetical protein
MPKKEKSSSTEDDSSTYLGSLGLGLSVAVVYGAYEASGGHLSDGAFYSITITVGILYVVTAAFRQHWKKLRFWFAILLMSGVHAALLRAILPRLRAVNFWTLMELFGPEVIAMILAVGLIVGDNPFTRNTRRAQAAAERLFTKAHTKPTE